MSLTPLQDLQPCRLYLRGWYGDHADGGVGHGGQQQHRWNRWALDMCVFSLPFRVQLELPYITACLHFASLLCDAAARNAEGGLEVGFFFFSHWRSSPTNSHYADVLCWFQLLQLLQQRNQQEFWKLLFTKVAEKCQKSCSPTSVCGWEEQSWIPVCVMTTSSNMSCVTLFM